MTDLVGESIFLSPSAGFCHKDNNPDAHKDEIKDPNLVFTPGSLA